MTEKTGIPEVLAPVGSMGALYAAIKAQADAIYLGVPSFNARGRSEDFSLDDLKRMIDLAHSYNLKVYLAVNILIFENELEKLFNLLEEVCWLGPDAFIVQDLGVAVLLSHFWPDIPLHGSTQMSIASSQAINLLETLNFKRFVLARENSLQEIAHIKQNTQKELEVFVHGALCVAYSGQCFTSEAIGGRSANRGQCAQSCRFSYKLFSDGLEVPLGEKSYLLSPMDLRGVEEVNELNEIGVSSLKIEGRLKGPAYVGESVETYKQKLLGNLQEAQKHAKNSELTYSRGFYSGWLHGVNHQLLVEGVHNSHQGILLGNFELKDGNLLQVDTVEEVIPGDGIKLEFAQGHGQYDFGAIVSYVTHQGNSRLIRYKINNKIPSSPLPLNQRKGKLFLNSRGSLHKTWDTLSLEDLPKIGLKVRLELDSRGLLLVDIFQNNQASSLPLVSFSHGPLNQSIQPISLAFIEQNLCSRTSEWRYQIEKLEFNGFHENLHFFINQKMIRGLKREILGKAHQVISAQRLKVRNPPAFSLKQNELYQKWPIPSSDSSLKDISPGIHLLLRTPAQAMMLLELLDNHPYIRETLRWVTLDLEHGHKLSPTLAELRRSGLEIGVATTRVHKEGEQRNIDFILNTGADFILVRNLGALGHLKQRGTEATLRGDFSFNAVNSWSIRYHLSLGLKTIMPGADLNSIQWEALLNKIPGQFLELPLHWYLPSFHMEHCVFAAFMSKGKDFRDCGKPCEKHQVHLMDQFGQYHHIKADQECRNTMFKGEAQSALEILDTFKSFGGKILRMELLNENPEEAQQKILSYGQFLKGLLSPQEILAKIGSLEGLGVQSHTLLRRDNYRDRKQNPRPIK